MKVSEQRGRRMSTSREGGELEGRNGPGGVGGEGERKGGEGGEK